MSSPPLVQQRASTPSMATEGSEPTPSYLARTATSGDFMSRTEMSQEGHASSLTCATKVSQIKQPTLKISIFRLLLISSPRFQFASLDSNDSIIEHFSTAPSPGHTRISFSRADFMSSSWEIFQRTPHVFHGHVPEHRHIQHPGPSVKPEAPSSHEERNPFLVPCG